MEPLTKFLSLDLELTKHSRKIIQIGACVFDIASGEIVDTLNVYVNPNEQLCDYIKDLTGITQEQVDNGLTLEAAYDKLVTMHRKHNCFRNMVQWGHGDSDCLKEQLKMDSELFIGGRRSIDVKTIYQSWRLSQGQPIQGGLAKSMAKLGLRFNGQTHSALDDAINTAKMYCALLDKFKA